MLGDSDSDGTIGTGGSANAPAFEEATLLADLDTAMSVAATTKRRYDDAGTVYTGRSLAQFEMILSPLGTITGDGFSVLIGADDSDPSSNTDPATGSRSDYLGVAYILVPEPSSLALLGLGGVALLRRRAR